MTNNRRRRTTTVATALLAGSAVAAAATLARRERNRTRPVLPVLELTPSHRAGTGTPLLLLHGIGAIWRVWSPVLPYLEPHHDVIVPTLAGHGGGPPLDPQTAPSIQALTDALEDELDRLGLQQVHIAGNSLGGLGGYASRADAIAANGLLRWSLLAGQVAHPNRVPPEALAAFIRAGSLAPVVAPVLREFPLRQVQPLPAVRDYPVRLVWADRDRALPFEGFGAPMLERLPGAELIRLHGVGHVPMSDDPITVAKLILEVTRAVDNAAVAT